MRTTGPGFSTKGARAIIVAELTADVRRLREFRALICAAKRNVRVISERPDCHSSRLEDGRLRWGDSLTGYAGPRPGNDRPRRTCMTWPS
jgi:hypothetical protein